jgi:hypothetical protein
MKHSVLPARMRFAVGAYARSCAASGAIEISAACSWVKRALAAISARTGAQQSSHWGPEIRRFPSRLAATFPHFTHRHMIALVVLR